MAIETTPVHDTDKKESPKFSRRRFIQGSAALAFASAGYKGENPSVSAADEDSNDIAMAPDSGEDLDTSQRMSAEDIREALNQNRFTMSEFSAKFHTAKSEVLLPDGTLDPQKTGEAYSIGLEVLLIAGCDEETLNDGHYLEDETPERFVKDLSECFDLHIIRGTHGFSFNMPTDEYLREHYEEYIDAAAASRRIFWYNRKNSSDFKPTIKTTHISSEFIEEGPEDHDGSDRYRINIHARISNNTGADEQSISLEALDGVIPMTVDIDPNQPQVIFIRREDARYANSPLTQLGSRY